MPPPLTLRALTEEEVTELRALAQGRKTEVRLRDRARICWLAHQDRRVPQIAAELGVGAATARTWIKRFNAAGLDGLRDAGRSGRPPTYTAEEVGAVLEASLTKPDELGLPFGGWTLDRLEAYVNGTLGIPIKRSRIGELLVAEGLCWRQQETWFGERPDPAFAAKKGAIVALYTAPPTGSVVICLDEMGPEAAKSFPGARLVRPDPTGARRARAPQEADYGRRGSGNVFGAFCPATGAALTVPDPGRTIANWVAFLAHVDAWVAAEAERVSAILDNLSTHRALDVLLWALAHPRWEFVFQPTSAASLNLIEPWWKVLRSLALKGRRFATWEEVCAAVEQGTGYWNNHRHPFVWGRRRPKRRQRARPAGIARLPLAA